jgi:N-acetylglucosamine-6-phosphate deacetylase
VASDRVVADGYLTVDDDGRIAHIGSRPSVSSQLYDINSPGCLVVPGFIDMHVHGGGGADFMNGTPEAVRQIARTHARFGTTGMLATTLTQSSEAIDSAVRAARSVMRDGRRDDEARILGIHLEGPYICQPRRGAQPPQFIRPPDLEEFRRWIELSEGTVRQITLAPEEPGARELVELAVKEKVIVSVGHTDATGAQVEEAARWGARQITHVFNGMRGLHHREPGVAGAALALPEYRVEVIADGVHLDPMIVKLIAAAKGPDGVLLITDAIEGAAMPDGDYRLGGNPVIVKDGTASYPDGTLAGSVLTMNRAFANTGRFTGLPPQIVARMAATNAARQLGLDAWTGVLEEGNHADFVVLSPEGEVLWTVIDGIVAYKK